MKRHPIKHENDSIFMYHAGAIYQFPRNIAEKYCMTTQHGSADDVFADLNKEYTRPGALLRGIRIRENLTQTEMGKRIKVTQSDISQMENGTRKIGRKVAQRIEELFGVDYRSFLD
jgi:DNA-binding XRE family transcriptional regulator